MFVGAFQPIDKRLLSSLRYMSPSSLSPSVSLYRHSLPLLLAKASPFPITSPSSPSSSASHVPPLSTVHCFQSATKMPVPSHMESIPDEVAVLPNHQNPTRPITVNSHIAIWWPEDKTFYPGVVTTVRDGDGKTVVFYDDGDFERLNMEEEHWKYYDKDRKVNIDVPLEELRAERQRNPQEEESFQDAEDGEPHQVIEGHLRSPNEQLRSNHRETAMRTPAAPPAAEVPQQARIGTSIQLRLPIRSPKERHQIAGRRTQIERCAVRRGRRSTRTREMNRMETSDTDGINSTRTSTETNRATTADDFANTVCEPTNTVAGSMSKARAHRYPAGPSVPTTSTDVTTAATAAAATAPSTKTERRRSQKRRPNVATKQPANKRRATKNSSKKSARSSQHHACSAPPTSPSGTVAPQTSVPDERTTAAQIGTKTTQAIPQGVPVAKSITNQETVPPVTAPAMAPCTPETLPQLENAINGVPPANSTPTDPALPLLQREVRTKDKAFHCAQQIDGDLIQSERANEPGSTSARTRIGRISSVPDGLGNQNNRLMEANQVSQALRANEPNLKSEADEVILEILYDAFDKYLQKFKASKQCVMEKINAQCNEFLIHYIEAHIIRGQDRVRNLEDFRELAQGVLQIFKDDTIQNVVDKVVNLKRKASTRPEGGSSHS